ncbi:MAG: choice-of-anchor D domain-containing protein, partial [candidate division NC10 bacterium]|nr:choice-of-anchor D domain-containing protein [candidate division NC10 bacterium]
MRKPGRPSLIFVVIFFLLSLSAVAQAEHPSNRITGKERGPGSRVVHTPPHAPDELLVRFKEGVSLRDMASGHALVGAQEVKRFDIVKNLVHVRLPHGRNVKEAIELYKQHPNVLYAEPNYLLEALTVPNDPRLGELWGLHNTGQSGGTSDADIDAPEAWDLATGSGSVVAAVIDSGIDYNHQDLSANMFRNTADCNTNGVDDDSNGFIDDCYGIDTANNDTDPMDDNSHGTHVAGTIGAVGNNSIGVVGVNWTTRLMACKFLDAAGSGYTSGAITCLDYVKTMKDRGVNIVATSNSWGGGEFSQSLLDAIEAHRQRGILFIAAAGNDAHDNDTALSYPASYYLPNIISVASTTRTDALSSFSNSGRRTVHLGAPGSAILSTTPGNTYSTFSGTSMATPHVTGLATLLKAQDSGRDWRTIKNLILAGGDTISSLTGTTITQKRLNARGALACSNPTVLSRLRPIATATSGLIGTPIDLAVLHINCGSPNGNVTVTVDPGNQTITLLDDGLGADQAAGDGTYSGQWTPSAGGTFTLTFPKGDVVTVYVLADYTVSSTSFVYRTIGGTSLNLGDDSSARITSPFPIRFGGGGFADLFVGSNGTLNFTGSFTAYSNTPVPTSQIATLVAPFWDDLFAVVGTSQNVFWEVTGTAPNRELVIEWRDVRQYTCQTDSAATVKFQVVFFEESSNMLFNYADAAFGAGCAFADRGGSATVGVQVGSTSGTQFSLNTQSLNNNTALLWTILQPEITVTPTSQDFGSVTVGSSADRTFTVQNTGVGTLTGSASATTPFSILSGSPFSLGAGLSRGVVVRFRPPSAATFASNVNFTSNGGNVSRAVTGSGAPSYGATYSPGTIASLTAGQTITVPVTVTNTGSLT